MLTDIALLVPIGVVVATIVSLTGVGGGVLWVPILMYVKGISIQDAILMSFAIQAVGTTSGAVGHLRARNVNFNIVKVALPIVIPSFVAGRFLGTYLPSHFLRIMLGVSALLTALSFVLVETEYKPRQQEISADELKQVRWILPILAIVSGTLSMGIGDWLIPFMKYKFNLRMRRLIGSMVFITSLLALSVSIYYLITSHSRLNFSSLIPAWIGVLMGGQIGSWLTTKIPDHKVKEVFVFVILILGIHITYNAF